MHSTDHSVIERCKHAPDPRVPVPCNCKPLLKGSAPPLNRWLGLAPLYRWFSACTLPRPFLRLGASSYGFGTRPETVSRPPIHTAKTNQVAKMVQNVDV